MFRLILVMVMTIELTGCTQVQRFALIKNAELDRCAMKRMAETKINGQQGYLQAHYECHQIVNIKKFTEMGLEIEINREIPIQKDPLEIDPICWAFVKGIYADEIYSAERIDKEKKMESLSEREAHKVLKESNEKLKLLSDRLSDIPTSKLVDVYELMSVNSTISHKTLCKGPEYHALRSVIGREIKRRKG